MKIKQKTRCLIGTLQIFFGIAVSLLISGCATQGYSVIASTGTTIGVGISQQPTNGAIEATLGYKRAEVAFVPTNRNGGESSANSIAGGAKDSSDVIMELRYSGIFSPGDGSGIYQRLAVGNEAVKQPGASLMFARDAGGKIDAQAESALKAVSKLPASNEGLEAKRAKIATQYASEKDSSVKSKYDSAAKNANYADFKAFLLDQNLTETKLSSITNALASESITINQ